ncbi:MAG: toxin-antitoxin system protein [Symploca sp. SIO1B1]|nr:toxin-antitoxin system protein [Symploca sp. SIO1C2]NER94505.1 toxin-antitoxin system protein [Symploca sp. SIO1B1]
MPDLTLNLSETTHKTLINLAEASGETMQTVLDKAIENYRRYIFLVQANQAFAVLRQNEALWQEELAERDLWDQTLSD